MVQRGGGGSGGIAASNAREEVLETQLWTSWGSTLLISLDNRNNNQPWFSVFLPYYKREKTTEV